MKKLPVGRKPEILWDVLFFMFTLIRYVPRRMCFMQRSLFLGFWFTCSLKIEANSKCVSFQRSSSRFAGVRRETQLFPGHIWAWSTSFGTLESRRRLQHQGDLYPAPGSFSARTHVVWAFQSTRNLSYPDTHFCTAPEIRYLRHVQNKQQFYSRGSDTNMCLTFLRCTQNQPYVH